jgi:ParB family transcriptional regulator, chromosome partitioning protein
MAFQGDSIFWVEVEKIVPNPFQPRREFDEMRLKELSESVRMYGILQPLTVTRREIQNEDGSFRSEYELIAGERRLRASKLAGLSQVPVIIREGDQSEQEKLELAIIENLQREDLNAVDRALAFRQLADVFGLSHTQVAQKVGRSREYVSNTIRLLALPDYMLTALRTADISEGHARTLLMLNDRPEEQDTVFREILLKKLSVREVERIARGIASEKIRKKGDYDADLVELEKKFTETLGTRVSIVKTEFGGRLSIDYFTQDDLMGMLERMKAEAAKAPIVIQPGDKNMTELGPLNEPGELANPRADELAILTERTGLEVVPEPVKEVIAEMNVPVVSAPAVAVMPQVSSFAPASITASPESAQPVLPPVPAGAPASSSLRDQLASLLGTAPVAAAAVVATEVLTEPQPVDTPVAVVPEMSESEATKEAVIPATESDDANLYDLKNFSI